MPYFHMKVPYFLKKEINEIYIMHSLRSFAVSTTSIFIPIYLLKHGFNFYEVALYFAVYTIANILFSLLALVYSSKKGARHSVLISIPLLIIFFIALHQTDLLIEFLGKITILILYPLLFSSAVSFYFMAFHLEFAKFSKSEKSAKEFGLVRTFSTAASIIGPLLGGLIIELFSFGCLFSLVVIILIFSVLPLFFSSELHEPFNFRIKDVLKYKKKAIPFLAEGFRFMAAKYFWPVLLYIMAIPLSNIGGIFTISSTLLALFTIYLGKKTTEANKHKLLKIGAIGNSVSLIIRTFLKTFSAIAIIQGLGGITWALVQLPYFSMFYNNSKKKGIPETIFMREFYLNLGRLLSIITLVLILIATSVKYALISTIIIGGLVMLLMTRVTDEKV
ncbi:MAG: MFS transporter [Nanobdellota archaeon]